jgi:hypothetical protein
MKLSRGTLVLEIHARTPRLVMLTFVRRLVVSTVVHISSICLCVIRSCIKCLGYFCFQFVMTLVVNLSWTNLVGCFFVRYLATALRGGCVLMMNGMLMIP